MNPHNPSSSPIKGRRAVVLGGGIAGLAAAGVLARHFEQVTVIERDRYDEHSMARPHAPQGAHIHALLARGLLTLSRLIPELPGWFDEIGLREGDVTYHIRGAAGGRWLPQVRSGILFRPCTRAALERLLVRDVSRRDNITVIEECKVEGLLGSERVRGVRVSRGGLTEEVSADLVIDAMGRASPAGRWLKDAGFPPVEEQVVDAGVVYSTCIFEPPSGIGDDWIVMGTLTVLPHEPCGVGLVRLAPDRILCSMACYGKPSPPRSVDEFIARTARLCVPEVHRLLRASTPVSEVKAFQATANRWRRYGRLPTFPEGFVIIGDAVCNLNPRYGQGMTVATLGAERLDSDLSSYFGQRGNLDGFGRHFQKSLEGVLKVPWQMAVMEDRLWISVFSGAEQTWSERLMIRSSARVLNAVFADVETNQRFTRVAHMLDTPMSLVSLKTLAAIARGGGRDVPSARPPDIGAS
ncbi:FAD-dependent oxidoreductase [Sorangium sp. So ce233]|uniref:FAD-dependent oxidoreductase n=1 Tax=Sorangium sp. So ce233 TaxID=3133290 RepID=UPI003F6107E5